MSRPVRARAFLPFKVSPTYWNRYSSDVKLITPVLEKLRAARADWQTKCKRADLEFYGEVADLLVEHGIPLHELQSGPTGILCHLLGHDPEEYEIEYDPEYKEEVFAELKNKVY